MSVESQMEQSESGYQTVGKTEKRPESEAKVRGNALYTAHIILPGMTHAKALRSPFPHALIRRVDATKAERVPGVVCTFTRDDLGPYNPTFGPVYYDQPVVCFDKVRFVGDPVAAIVAEDEDTAEEALSLIEVEYEELRSVTSLDEALADEAPLVHEKLELPSEGFTDLKTVKPYPGTNIWRLSA